MLHPVQEVASMLEASVLSATVGETTITRDKLLDAAALARGFGAAMAG